MFSKLKEKLKGAVQALTGVAKNETITEQLQEETPEENIVEPTPQPETELIVETEKPIEENKTQPEIREEIKQPSKPEPNPESQLSKKIINEERKESLFSRVSKKITTIQLSTEQFEEAFWDVEMALLENNVAIGVIEKIKEDLKKELTENRTARGDVQERIIRQLRESFTQILNVPQISLIEEAQRHSPYIIAIVGINGTGKTTTIAKLTNYFLTNNKTVVLAAADTFRAAAIQQLEEHAKKLNVGIIKQDYGADPAAVAFDAVAHAKAKNIDVVIIDTAGRMHSNNNLMQELEKVIRISKPHTTLFVGEATTGNDCIEQAQAFNKHVDIDGIILSKSDIDEQGGASISVSYVTKKPILFLGTGQKYEDLKAFSAEDIINNLL